MFNWPTTSSRPPFHFVSRFELSTRFIEPKKSFLVHWWCVYYNQPTSTPLNRRFWNSVRRNCPVNPDGGQRWHWLWSACSISSFHLVHLSGKRRSELALTWYYNTTSADKWLICQQPMRIQDFFLAIWLDDENSNLMLKNRICPGNKPRLFWVTFKLMIFQNFESFHFSKIWKILLNQPGQAPRVSRPAPFIALHFDFPSFWLVDFRPLDGNNLYEAIKDLVLYFSILSEKAQIRPTCYVGHFRIYFWRV